MKTRALAHAALCALAIVVAPAQSEAQSRF